MRIKSVTRLAALDRKVLEDCTGPDVHVRKSLLNHRNNEVFLFPPFTVRGLGLRGMEPYLPSASSPLLKCMAPSQALFLQLGKLWHLYRKFLKALEKDLPDK
jgi:hypothetical protein